MKFYIALLEEKGGGRRRRRRGRRAAYKLYDAMEVQIGLRLRNRAAFSFQWCFLYVHRDRRDC